MSKLLLNLNKNNIVFINGKGEAEFQIQSKGGLSTAPTPILFKIITNGKQNITINPANRVLFSQGPKSKSKIKVKFTGNDIDMKKTKLQIRWMTLASDLELFPQLQSILIFHDFYRKCIDKYKQQKIQMTLQSSNQHNIEDVQKQINPFKQGEHNVDFSRYVKNEEGDVFYYVYLESKGISEQTINILKKENIKNLKKLKKFNVNKLLKANINLCDIIALEEVISK